MAGGQRESSRMCNDGSVRVQYEAVAIPTHAIPEQLMDLPAALAAAMPAPGWARTARTGILVACLVTEQWRSWWQGDGSRQGKDFDAAIDGIMGAAERSRVERKRRREDRENTAFAYACHRVLLSAALGCPPAEVPLMRDGLGCPRLDDGSAHTSLSHADGLVAIAISMAGPVGVDIEPIHRTAAMAEISARVLHVRELAALSTLPADGRNAALLALWVRKEALLKAAGIGLAREMDEFEAPAGEILELPDGAGGTAVIRMLDGDGRSSVAVAGLPGRAVHSAWLHPPH